MNVHQHRTQKRPVVLISAYRSIQPREFNDIEHEELGQHLRRFGFPIKEVHGVYKNVPERTWVVELHPDKDWQARDLRTLLSLGSQYRQESILYLDKGRNATLHYVGGKEFATDLGRFAPVPKQVARKFDSYTRDGNDYYVCLQGES